MCVLWYTSGGLTSVKQAVFSNFYLAYIPRRPHPPPDNCCDKEDHWKGRLHCIFTASISKSNQYFISQYPRSLRRILGCSSRSKDGQFRLTYFCPRINSTPSLHHTLLSIILPFNVAVSSSNYIG